MKGKGSLYLNIFEKAVPRYYSDNVFAGYIGCMFDLTQEKQFQQTLELEKQKLELLTQNSPDIVLLADQRGHIEYVSGTIKRILGYKESEVIGKNIRTFICKECKQQLHKTSWLFDFKTKIQKYEYRMTTKAGKDIWVESVLSVIKNEDEQGYKILMHNRDIDSLKKTEIALTEREQKYRGIFENMNLGVMEVDLNEKIVWVNQSFEMMTGYSFKYMKGKRAVDLFLTETPAKRLMDHIKHKRMNRSESIYEIKMRKNKGEMIDVVISGSPVIDFYGNVKGSVGIHWDVTEIRKIERMLEEEKTTRQNEIMKATLEGEEKQKLQIGHELHDGVGHLLTYTSLFLQMTAQQDHVKPEQVSKAHAKVEEALLEIKRLSKNLVSSALNDLGLKEAIIELFNQQHSLKNTKFKLECASKDLRDLDMTAQRNLYRIIQELVNNTIKHAKAELVWLKIERNKHQLLLHYHNDGKAFNPNTVKRGIGLDSILNRTTFYNGKMDITSNPQKGTDFKIALPLTNILKHE
jgi:PAS domain S-box-containing protein